MGGVDLQLHSLLVAALDGGESSALRSGLFNPRVNCIPHSTAKGSGWVVTHCVVVLEKRKYCHLLRIEPRFLCCAARNTSVLF